MVVALSLADFVIILFISVLVLPLECTRALAITWKSEDNLRCRSGDLTFPTVDTTALDAASSFTWVLGTQTASPQPTCRLCRQCKALCKRRQGVCARVCVCVVCARVYVCVLWLLRQDHQGHSQAPPPQPYIIPLISQGRSSKAHIHIRLLLPHTEDAFSTPESFRDTLKPHPDPRTIPATV